MALLLEDRLDDPRSLRLAETPIPQEIGTLVVGSRDEVIARRHDPLDEWHRARICELLQRRRCLVREAVGGVFGVPDRDLLEAFDTPQVPVLAHRTKIET